MANKFIQGEWKVDSNHKSIVLSNKGYFIADCSADIGALTRPVVEANAHLISKSPILHEALKEIIEDYNDHHQVTQASINKASRLLAEIEEEK